MTRILAFILTALFLAGCSMQVMSEKLVPEDVRAQVNAEIDAVVAGDMEVVLSQFPEVRDTPEFRDQMARLSATVPDARETARDVVGVQARTEQAYSATDGAVRTGTYNLAHELTFDNGRYLLFRTAHTFDDAGECCVLRAITASAHDESPVKAQLARQSRVMKVVGLMLLITTLATGAFLIIRIGGRRARAAQMEG